MARRSVSSPISNNSTTTPTSASRRNTGVRGSSGPTGMTFRNPAPSRMPAISSPITAGCPRRSKASPASFAATSITASTVKKRAKSPPPAAPSRSGTPVTSAHARRLEGLSRLRMEVEAVVEEREVDRLAVQRFNHDLARRRAADDLDLLRSEEHTSELQSQSNLVCRLLLEKKDHKSGTHGVKLVSCWRSSHVPRDATFVAQPPHSPDDDELVDAPTRYYAVKAPAQGDLGPA